MKINHMLKKYLLLVMLTGLALISFESKTSTFSHTTGPKQDEFNQKIEAQKIDVSSDLVYNIERIILPFSGQL